MLMGPEQLFFIHTLTDYIHQRRTTVPDYIDREKVHFYAGEHQLEPIFYRQTKLDEYRGAFLGQLNLSLLQESVRKEIDKTLDGIPFFKLKGTMIAAFYPDPELRTMSDLDYVVHPEDRERAHDCLMKIGAEVVRKMPGEWIYSYRDVLIELHSCLIYGYSKATTYKRQRAFFNNCWGYCRDGELDFNFHVLFLFMHLRKHIMETGIGFRQFMDIALIVQNSQADWKWIRSKAEELELFPFIKTALTMIEMWFGVPSPYERTAVPKSFYEEATLHIFNDGVFGFDNVANRNNRAINERASHENPLYGVKYFMEQFFWPYEKLITMPEYRWLIDRKWLLPAAWIVRSVKKWENKEFLFMRYFASKKAVRKRYAYLNQWNVGDVGHRKRKK